jgi:non-ribosomal peptide synthase protein (TIGR01720 family)
MVYRLEEKGIVQYNRGVEGELFHLEIIDGEAAVKEEADRIQGSMNLEKGPLVRLGLFKTAKGDHLLIAIHHLVVDGVSWRIIFEDFSIGYMQALKGEEIRFQDKTDSYREWSMKLREYATGEQMQNEAGYWSKLGEIDIQPLKKDGEKKEGRVKDSDAITVELENEETEELLKRASKAYGTEVNDILLTALGLAMKEYTGADNILIDLEGHGREQITEDIDISRTVGWFTSIYPVILDMSFSGDIQLQIKTVKESLRDIPVKGIGYGILKYLATAEGGKGYERLKPEILFNYLGQFDSDMDNGIFRVSKLSAGESVSMNNERLYALEINCMITGGRLTISLSCDKDEYTQATIATLAERYKTKLKEMIRHCVGKEESELTPSDLSSNGIDMDEIEDVYNFL